MQIQKHKDKYKNTGQSRLGLAEAESDLWIPAAGGVDCGLLDSKPIPPPSPPMQPPDLTSEMGRRIVDQIDKRGDDDFTIRRHKYANTQIQNKDIKSTG